MSKKTLIGGLGGLVNRAPSAIGGVGHRMPALFAGGANNAEAQMGAMGSVGTLFAIVHRTSNATSAVDWKLWRKPTGSGGRAAAAITQRVEVTRHAALDLWNNPNPFYTRQALVESVEQHVDLVGEGVIVVYRDPRSTLPLELWPVRPDRITPIPGGDFLVGYIYTGMNGEQVPLGLDEVIHLKMPNPLDPYRGLGPVQAAMVDLDSARYSAEWNRNFFVNSAEPGGIIEVPDRLDDEAFKELTTRWREQHQGVAQAHRVAVLEQGTWKDRSMSQRDMQFVQLRGLSREVIREAFGIHGHMLGNSQDVNKANAEAGEISFARWLVKPRVERIKQAINHRLLPMFDATDLEFDHERVVPEDREADDRERTSKAAAAKTLIDAGFDPAGTLAAFDLPDIPYAEGGVDLRNIVEMIQKVYLGVDTVVTADEARAMLREAGANLGTEPFEPAPDKPAEQPAQAVTPVAVSVTTNMPEMQAPREPPTINIELPPVRPPTTNSSSSSSDPDPVTSSSAAPDPDPPSTPAAHHPDYNSYATGPNTGAASDPSDHDQAATHHPAATDPE